MSTQFTEQSEGKLLCEFNPPKQNYFEASSLAKADLFLPLSPLEFLSGAFLTRFLSLLLSRIPGQIPLPLQ